MARTVYPGFRPIDPGLPTLRIDHAIVQEGI